MKGNGTKPEANIKPVNQNCYSILEGKDQSEGESTTQMNKELESTNRKKHRDEEKSHDI